MKKRILSLFALLLVAVVGAWAQEETLLTTLTFGESDTPGETTSGVVSVTAINVEGNSAAWGWTWDSSGSLSVTANEGYTITKCVFRQNEKTPITDTEAPFEIHAIDWGFIDEDPYYNMNGVTSIEVYGYASAPATTYNITLADGTVDAAKWTIAPNPAAEGAEVTLTYTGKKKVKSVNLVKKEAVGNIVDLSTLTGNYEAQDGDVLTGTLAGNYKISIADGATVTLSGAVINGANSGNWAGLTLAGDGTIILAGENSVKGFYEDYPGIFVPVNKTLTIQGDGSLTASSNGYGAGIGGGFEIASGNITIEGGTVTATGGSMAAGIGGSRYASCGDISITGGTVTATGGNYAAGIGSGANATCGAITITSGVTKVTATKADNATNSIGKGSGGSCGTVTIGGTVYPDGISTSPYTYDPSAPTARTLADATAEDLGKVVCAAGHLHDAKTAVPTGCTAVGIVGKVTETGHGLILALQDATSQTWNAINGWASVTAYAGTTLKLLPDATARGSLTSYTALGSTAVSNWAVAQKDDYDAIFQNLGSTTGNYDGKTHDANVNAYITTGVGGTEISILDFYWSATEYPGIGAYYFYGYGWMLSGDTADSYNVRPVLGFGGEVATARTLAETTAEDLGKLIGADGNIYDTKGDAETAGTTAVAMIAYVGSDTDHATYTHGLAIALADEESESWSTAKSTCEDKPAVSGAAWLLPSQDQWTAMLAANGDEYSCSGLNTAITTAGGTALQKFVYYWSSTEEDGDYAYAMFLDDYDVTWDSYKKDKAIRVRACLAF